MNVIACLIKFLKKQYNKLFFPDNALRRRAWIESVLTSIPSGKSILDVGCGTQQYRRYCSHLRYLSQDFGRYDGVGDNKGLQRGDWMYGKLDYVGNAWDIDEKDCSFDVILCTEVIEHLYYPNETITELTRILAPNGILILTAPVCSIPHFSPYYYYNGFSEYYYREAARINKINLEYIETNGDAFEYLGVELRRTLGATPPVFRLPYLCFVLISIQFFKIMSLIFGNKCKYLVGGYHLIFRKPSI
jgi:SAM-dependent methyltransferase